MVLKKKENVNLNLPDLAVSVNYQRRFNLAEKQIL